MSISSRITQIEQHLTDDYSVLELAGADLTNVDKNIENLKQSWEERLLYFLANGTDTLWNNWEKVTGSGTEISLNNTIEAKMDFIYKGNTSQSGEPTPDTPVPVQVVSGDNTIKVEGKNLFDKSKISSVLGGTNNNGVITSNNLSNAGLNLIVYFNQNGNIDVSSGDTIYFSADIKLNSGSSGFWNNINDGVNGGTTKILYPTISTTYQKYQTSFTYSSDTTITKLLFQFFSVTGTIEISNIMISKNNNATYEQYQTPQTHPISLGNIELCKIGEYQDRIYKDNGKWYLNKQIGKVVLDGSEKWDNLYGTNLFTLTSYLNSKPFVVGYGLSNYYKYNSIQSGVNAGTVNGEFVLQQSQGHYSGHYSIHIKNTNCSTPADFKTWLGTHNTNIYYPLATPTYEEITDTTLISQLEAIKKSYNSQTSISQVNNDLPFELDVVALGELESI